MLLIDAGNSSLKWSLSVDGRSPIDSRSFDYRQGEWQVALQYELSQVQVQAVWISCVAGAEIEKKLTEWFNHYWQVMPTYVRSTKECLGVTNSYPQVSDLGVDRWLALIAVHHNYSKAACVIDCGTAVTMDFLDVSGRHIGGLIMPGLQLMKDALYRGTSLKNKSLENNIQERASLAQNTSAAIDNGCYLMLSESIKAIFCRFEKMMGDNLLCVLTGGDGELLEDRFESYEYQKDLVLCGLYLVASARS